jgi:hypothetical protein
MLINVFYIYILKNLNYHWSILNRNPNYFFKTNFFFYGFLGLAVMLDPRALGPTCASGPNVLGLTTMPN